MELIFEGKLSAECRAADVLRQVAGHAALDAAILRIGSPAVGLNGRVALRDSRFVVGARVFDSDANGYQAVKQLLSIDDGNYAFLDAGGQLPDELDQGLHLSLERLIAALPVLPQDPAELFDEKSLLDAVFGTGREPPKRTEEIPSFPKFEAEPGQTPEKQPAWEVLTPFLFGTATGGKGGTSDVTLAEGPARFEKLKRAAVTRTSWRAVALWIVAIAAIALSAVFVSSTIRSGQVSPGAGTSASHPPTKPPQRGRAPQR